MSALTEALAQVQARPQDADVWVGLGKTFMGAGQPKPAAEAFQQALRRAPSTAAFRGWADAAVAQGQITHGVAVLTAAQGRGMLDHDGLLALGRYAMDANDLSAAAKALHTACTQRPEDGQSFLLLGIVEVRRGRADVAAPMLERACSLSPDNVDAHANLATVRETLNQLDAAATAAKAALALDPHHGLAGLCLARVLRRQGHLDESLALLDTIDDATLAPHHAARREVERGLCLDRKGNSQGAWDAFSAMNAHAQRRPGLRVEAAQSWRATVDEIRTMAPDLAGHAVGLRDEALSGEAPVFITGFPRSGTTLIETILGAHPALWSCGEQPITDVFLRRWTALMSDAPAYPQGLLAVGPERRAVLRRDWLEARDAVLSERPVDRRLIDKVPLNLVHLPLLHALFPEAPLIVVLRDPRDAALSCFMQDFGPGVGNLQMMDMHSIVGLMQAVFATYAAVKPVLGDALTVVRYEDVVEDQPGETARLLTALGLPWDDRVAKYWTTTAGRHVATPSYSQVSQPISTKARGRWRRYCDQLGPWREPLDQLAVDLGYSAD